MRVYGLIIILLAVSVFAQLPEEQIEPPKIPTGTEVEVRLLLFDSSTKISNIHAHVHLSDYSGKEINTLKYVDESGILNLELDPGLWKIKILIDDIETPGKDYVYSTQLEVKKEIEERIYLMRAGSVQGSVYVGSEVISLATVYIECSGETDLELTSDLSGFFSAHWLPVGPCIAFATNGDERGQVEFSVEKGKLATANIYLSESLASKENVTYIFAVLVVIFLFAVFMYFRKKQTVNIHKHNDRKESVLKTLNEKEKKVVHYLLEHENKSTQSTLKHETGIPKTTLIRLFSSLESKNIIQVEKVGKLKKISLTNWFLGK